MSFYIYVFLKNESRTMIIFVSESQSQNMSILGRSLPTFRDAPISAGLPPPPSQRHFKHWIQKYSKILLSLINWKVALYTLNIIGITIQIG
jgi:hypothetical protein